MKQPAVYIVASKRNGTLYTGVTSDLVKRIYEHRESVVKGFTKKYSCKMLVYYEMHEEMESAILREKQIKAGSRKKKLELIEAINPSWKDLYEEIIGLDCFASLAMTEENNFSEKASEEKYPS